MVAKLVAFMLSGLMVFLWLVLLLPDAALAAEARITQWWRKVRRKR